MKKYQLPATMAVAAGSFAAMMQTADWVKWALTALFAIAVFAMGSTVLKMLEQYVTRRQEHQQLLMEELNQWQKVFSNQAEQVQTEVVTSIQSVQAELVVRFDELLTSDEKRQQKNERRLQEMQERQEFFQTEQTKQSQLNQEQLSQFVQRLLASLNEQQEQTGDMGHRVLSSLNLHQEKTEQIHKSLHCHFEKQNTYMDDQSDLGQKLTRALKNQYLLLQDMNEQIDTVNDNVEESSEAFSSSQEDMKAMSNHFNDRIGLFQEAILKLSDVVEELLESRAVERQEALQVQEGLIEKLKRYQKVDA
ncbi:hypothetical protein [Exiguobacterium sp. s149]|uniref:hypothetical protein n=1 Tax=Exiguobacterium TaxID=33986 RepID=UPI001BEB2EFD|nr:hypothetical protein [Exiguobacterium sp. s149]